MLEKAILGMGCFWCSEAIFKRVKGVIEVVPGYSGGNFPNPTYEEVCSDKTGHAEVIQITFDTDKLSFNEILDIFFSLHDPTTKNRQGNDIGSQYRSIILYHNEGQRKIAEEMIRAISSKIGKKVVTELKEFESFYPAEDYHRNYYERNKTKPYCAFVISPKIEKLFNHFKEKIKQ